MARGCSIRRLRRGYATVLLPVTPWPPRSAAGADLSWAAVSADSDGLCNDAAAGRAQAALIRCWGPGQQYPLTQTGPGAGDGDAACSRK
jgi:hypothetical protein